jgi:N-acetyl-alpha-D-muramate 1-phosphate uridylyltransferase
VKFNGYYVGASPGLNRLPPVAILAGGLATRMLPFTEKIPKALLPVNGEPFVAHQLRLLESNGVKRVVLCAGHLGELIREFIGDGSRFHLSVEFSFDGPRSVESTGQRAWDFIGANGPKGHPSLLGTAGAVRKALPQLGSEFFVLYGDSYLPCDYRAVLSAFHASGKAALMTVFRNDSQWDSSNVEYSGGKIWAYDKRAPSNRMKHIDYGLGVFRESAFAALPGDPPYDLADLYQELLTREELAAFESDQRFYEIGSQAGLQELSDHLIGRAGSGGAL